MPKANPMKHSKDTGWASVLLYQFTIIFIAICLIFIIPYLLNLFVCGRILLIERHEYPFYNLFIKSKFHTAKRFVKGVRKNNYSGIFYYYLINLFFASKLIKAGVKMFNFLPTISFYNLLGSAFFYELFHLWIVCVLKHAAGDKVGGLYFFS